MKYSENNLIIANISKLMVFINTIIYRTIKNIVCYHVFICKVVRYIYLNFTSRDWLAMIIFMQAINKKLEKLYSKNKRACLRVSKCQAHKIKFMVISEKVRMFIYI